MNKTKIEKTINAMFVFIAAATILSLGLLVAAIYAAIHFIVKVW